MNITNSISGSPASMTGDSNDAVLFACYLTSQFCIKKFKINDKILCKCLAKQYIRFKSGCWRGLVCYMNCFRDRQGLEDTGQISGELPLPTSVKPS